MLKILKAYIANSLNSSPSISVTATKALAKLLGKFLGETDTQCFISLQASILYWDLP